MLADYSTLPRVQRCGRCRTARGQNPQVRMNGAVAHYANVMLCGSAWACPVCSPRIRQFRAVQVDTALQRWIERHGPGSVALLGLTLPHDRGDRLEPLLATVRKAFSRLVAGRAWQADKAAHGIAYHIVAHDVTVGPNGWHPHLHIILLATRELTDADVDGLHRKLHARWARHVAERGHREPSLQHGVHIERARSRADVGRYVCQVVGENEGDRGWGVAMEATRTDLKVSQHDGHRSPWQVLQDFADYGDTDDLKLWREYECATASRLPAVRMSKGLRGAVGLDDKELTDEEVVAVQVGGETVYEFTDPLTWLAVCQTRRARARVLRAAERWGARGCARLVAGIRNRWEATRAARATAHPRRR